MKIAMVSGSWPPQRCGVGDYADTLARRIETLGHRVVRISHDDWSRAKREEIANAIEEQAPEIVHIHYPTLGYRNSRTAPWLAYRLRRLPLVATLHEYRAILRPNRRFGVLPRGLSFWPFVLGDALVFSGEPERDAFATAHPMARNKSHVISIGSSIPAAPGDLPRGATMVFFGQISPNRGIEAFLEAATILRDGRDNISPVLIGSVPEAVRDYAYPMLDRLRAIGAEVLLDAEADEVAARLRRAMLAYLPFPDGASPKRTSLLAALTNGTVTITPHGPETPAWLRGCTVHAEGPIEAVRHARMLFQNQGRQDELRRNALAEAPRFDWNEITLAYEALYADIAYRPRK